MSGDQMIYRNILENMTDGVMTIGRDGLILTFNGAAEKILNLRQADVLNRPFSEIFLTKEGNDAFNQTILNAVYDAAAIHNSTVEFFNDEKVLTLSVTTSFLKRGEEGESGVIVVFSDRTEVEKLRATEIELGQEIKAKHNELQESYLKLEETNTTLNAALKKVQMIRIAATAFVIILFVSVGLFTWMRAHPGSPARTPSEEKKTGMATLTVAATTLTDSISLRGILKPIKIVNVTSPFSGTVKEKYFEYGQTVAKGQPLLRMDTFETEQKYRDAKSAFIEADKKLKQTLNWKSSDEMARATRSLDKSKRTFQETEALFKKGIVSQDEYENAKINYENELQAYKAEKAKGEGESLALEKLKFDNAKVRLAHVEAQLSRAEVCAPVSGTIMLPDLAGKAEKGKTAEQGTAFSQGDILLSIGDTEGISITAEVDEIEIMKIKKGQEVAITGDAFPGVTLNGKVSHVSSQAKSKGSDMGQQKTASFEITITVDRIPPAQVDMLRLGMSTNVTILVLNKPGAILIPIPAVHLEGPDRLVTVRDRQTGGLKKVRVETGITTVDSVEIIKGIQAGDEIVQ